MTTTGEVLNIWRRATVEGVRRASPDLSARQMALLLTVYLTPSPHTVRGLASVMAVSKPVISRALDRLGRLGLVRRKIDQTDRRNVLVQRTVKGSVYLSEFGDIVRAALEATTGSPEPSSVPDGPAATDGAGAARPATAATVLSDPPRP